MKLDTKSPVGNGITRPEEGYCETGRTIGVSLKHDGGINNGASTENRSAQFKNPQAKAGVPADDTLNQ